jgi:hypothetical protein
MTMSEKYPRSGDVMVQRPVRQISPQRQVFTARLLMLMHIRRATAKGYQQPRDPFQRPKSKGKVNIGPTK